MSNDNIKSLLTILENASEEELSKIGDILSGISGKKENVGDNEEPPTKPKTPKSPGGRREPRNAIKDSVKQITKGGKKIGKGGGRTARSEPVVLSGVNKFERMTEKNSHKEDAKIDKLLWGERQPTPRPEKYEDVEVQCNKCDLWYDINPSLVYTDPDTHKIIFTCDNCSRG